MQSKCLTSTTSKNASDTEPKLVCVELKQNDGNHVLQLKKKRTIPILAYQ